MKYSLSGDLKFRVYIIKSGSKISQIRSIAKGRLSAGLFSEKKGGFVAKGHWGGHMRSNVLDNCHNCDRFLIECGQFDMPGEMVELLLLLLLLLPLRHGRGRMHVAPRCATRLPPR